MKLVTGRSLAFSVLLLLGSAANAHAASARDFWKEVIKKCAASDQIGKTTYLGPSNLVGTGALWRKSGGSYEIRATLAMMEPDPVLRELLLQDGAFATCDGTKSTKMDLSGSVALESKAQPFEATLGGDLARARSVSVSIGAWRWDSIIGISYEEMVRRLAGPIADDFTKPSRLVARRALRIRGLLAELKFESAIGASLKAKYDGKTMAIGGVEAKVSFSNNETMQIRSDSEFFVAAELRKWEAGALAAESARIGDQEEDEEERPISLALIQ